MNINHETKTVENIETMKPIHFFGNGQPAMLYESKEKDSVRVYFSDGQAQYADVLGKGIYKIA